METNIKKALKFFESIQLKRDEVSGTILRKMGLRWEVVELVDLWIEAAKKADIGLGEVKAMVQSKYVAKPYNSVKEWLEKQRIRIGRALTGNPPSYTTVHTDPYTAVQKS